LSAHTHTHTNAGDASPHKHPSLFRRILIKSHSIVWS